MENISYVRNDIRGCPNDSDITDYIIKRLRTPQNFKPPDLILHSGDDFRFEIHKVNYKRFLPLVKILENLSNIVVFFHKTKECINNSANLIRSGGTSECSQFFKEPVSFSS